MSFPYGTVQLQWLQLFTVCCVNILACFNTCHSLLLLTSFPHSLGFFAYSNLRSSTSGVGCLVLLPLCDKYWLWYMLMVARSCIFWTDWESGVLRFLWNLPATWVSIDSSLCGHVTYGVCKLMVALLTSLISLLRQCFSTSMEPLLQVLGSLNDDTCLGACIKFVAVLVEESLWGGREPMVKGTIQSAKHIKIALSPAA